MNLLVHFVNYGHSWCFESSQIALAYGSCNFENFQNHSYLLITNCTRGRAISYTNPTNSNQFEFFGQVALALRLVPHLKHLV